MRQIFYHFFAIASLYGVFCTKGYNSTACAYVCCMSLLCMLVSSIKVSTAGIEHDKEKKTYLTINTGD